MSFSKWKLYALFNMYFPAKLYNRLKIRNYRKHVFLIWYIKNYFRKQSITYTLNFFTIKVLNLIFEMACELVLHMSCHFEKFKWYNVTYKHSGDISNTHTQFSCNYVYIRHLYIYKMYHTVWFIQYTFASDMSGSGLQFDEYIIVLPTRGCNLRAFNK